jgi:tol-pal system protein YbgF
MLYLKKKSTNDVVGFIKLFIFFPAVIILLISCAAQKDVIYLNKQLNALYQQTKKDGKRFEKSIKKLEEAIQAGQAKHHANKAKQRETEKTFKEDWESLRLNLAQLGADLVGIRDDIQTLTGRVEENSYLLKRTIEEDTTKEDFMVSQLKQLSLMVEELQSRIEKIEDHFGFETSADKKEDGLEKALPTQEIKQKDVSVSQKKKPTESELYDRTLGYYRDGQYEKAIAGFKDFLKFYHKSDLADNANFWIGECNRALEKYEEAILAYQKVINGYPKGNKVPSAMLHQALTFEKINDRTTANLVFKRLVKNFPKTKEAEIARKRLKQD